MTTQKKFIGGYVSPELYHYFDDQATEQGLSKNAFLEILLTAHQMEDEFPTPSEQPTEEFSLADYFEDDFYQEFNDLIIAAGDGWQDDPARPVADFFTLLALLLETAIDIPLASDDDSMDYRTVVPDGLHQPIANFIIAAMDDLPDEGSREDFLDILSAAAYDKAAALKDIGAEATVAFSAEEWTAIQQLLKKTPEATDVASYLRQLLGTRMQEEANGVLWVEDPEMWAIGEGMTN